MFFGKRQIGHRAPSALVRETDMANFTFFDEALQRFENGEHGIFLPLECLVIKHCWV